MPELTRSRIARRSAWTLADQAISSLTNILFVALVARTSTVVGFGRFQIVFTVFVFVYALSRSLCVEPLLIRFASAERKEFRAVSATAVSSAGLVGLCAMFLLLALVPVWPSARAALVTVGLSLPAILAQDSWRLIFVAEGHPRKAFLNDLFWFFSSLALYLVLHAFEAASLPSLTLAWGGGALAAALLGSAQMRLWPAARGAVRWIREQRDLSPGLVGDRFGQLAANYLTIYTVGLVAGLEAVAGFRGAWLFFGPLTVLLRGVGNAALPEISRLRQTRPEGFLTAIGVISALVGGVALVLTAVLNLMPESIGEQILGETWRVARPVLLPLGIAFFFLSATHGPSIGFRALERASEAASLRWKTAPLIVVFSTLGAAAWGATGAAAGFAGGYLVASILWWIAFLSVASLGVAASHARPVTQDSEAPGFSGQTR